MNPDTRDEIEIALTPAPMDGPSEGLVRRLRVLAHETAPRTAWWRSPLAAPTMVAGGLFAAIAVTAMLPAKASAKSFDLILQAAGRINAFQFSIDTDQEGKKMAFTVAGNDGHVYMSTSEGGFLQLDPGMLSLYNKREDRVLRFRFDGMVDAETLAREVQSGLSEGMREMDLRRLLQEYRRKYGAEGVYVSPVVRENGHGVYHVTLSRRDEPERVSMTVDAATDLPETLRVDSGNGTLMRMTMRFGAQVDASLLRSRLPASAKVEEIDASKMVDKALKGLEKIGEAFAEGSERPEKP